MAVADDRTELDSLFRLVLGGLLVGQQSQVVSGGRQRVLMLVVGCVRTAGRQRKFKTVRHGRAGAGAGLAFGSPQARFSIERAHGAWLKSPRAGRVFRLEGPGTGKVPQPGYCARHDSSRGNTGLLGINSAERANAMRRAVNWVVRRNEPAVETTMAAPGEACPSMCCLWAATTTSTAATEARVDVQQRVCRRMCSQARAAGQPSSTDACAAASWACRATPLYGARRRRPGTLATSCRLVGAHT